MSSERHLRRKYTFRAENGSAGSEQVVFVKQKQERAAHVFMKAFLWALYLPDYPQMRVEVPVGDKYKPDVVALDPWGDPRFWGEAGAVSTEKTHALVQRYPRTHFALAKWDTALDPFAEIVREAARETTRHAPFDLLRFPPDSHDRFIDAKGRIRLSFEDFSAEGLDWRRL